MYALDEIYLLLQVEKEKGATGRDSPMILFLLNNGDPAVPCGRGGRGEGEGGGGEESEIRSTMIKHLRP